MMRVVAVEVIYCPEKEKAKRDRVRDRGCCVCCEEWKRCGERSLSSESKKGFQWSLE